MHTLSVTFPDLFEVECISLIKISHSEKILTIGHNFCELCSLEFHHLSQSCFMLLHVFRLQ